jgi:hypothetical protein
MRQKVRVIKKLLFILCLITSSITYAQNNLPPCNGNFKGPCFGNFDYPSGNKYVGQFKDDKYGGFGTLYNANGSINQQGLWRDNNFVQAQTPPTVTPPVAPKPPVNNAQDIKRQKCIRLGLAPGSADFQQCIN